MPLYQPDPATSAWQPWHRSILTAYGWGGSVVASSFLGGSALKTLNTSGSMDALLPYFDSADFPSGSRTLQLRMRTWLVTDSTAPACNFTLALQPVATFGTVANVAVIATLGAAVLTTTYTTPGASTQLHTETTPITFPAAGYYVFNMTNSATTAANSSQYMGFELQYRRAP